MDIFYNPIRKFYFYMEIKHWNIIAREKCWFAYIQKWDVHWPNYISLLAVNKWECIMFWDVHLASTSPTRMNTRPRTKKWAVSKHQFQQIKVQTCRNSWLTARTATHKYNLSQWKSSAPWTELYKVQTANTLWHHGQHCMQRNQTAE